MKLHNNVDSTDLSEAVKEYTIPAQHKVDGVSVPVSPVVLVDPSSDPHRLVPQGWWLYQARRVNTQGVAGPNALITRIQMNPGQVGKLVCASIIGTASAGNATYCRIVDEDGATIGNLGNIAATASAVLNLPSIGTVATATTNIIESNGLLIGPGSYFLSGATVSIAAETLTVGVVLLLSTPDVPLWDTTGSGGTPTLAASTISAANSMQKVDLPW